MLGEELPNFLRRIFDVRAQINSLAVSNFGQSEKIQELEYFNQMNQNLQEFQTQTLCDETILSSQQNLLNFAKLDIESLLKNYFGFQNVVLRQVLRRPIRQGADTTSLISDDNTKELIRMNDHPVENREVIEDFLDYKKEYYVHQISVCPRILDSSSFDQSYGAKFGELTFII